MTTLGWTLGKDWFKYKKKNIDSKFIHLWIRLREEQLRKQLAQEQQRRETTNQQVKERGKNEEERHLKEEEEKRKKEQQEKVLQAQMEREVSGLHKVPDS